jgi:hypothetical protein
LILDAVSAVVAVVISQGIVTANEHCADASSPQDHAGLEPGAASRATSMADLRGPVLPRRLAVEATAPSAISETPDTLSTRDYSINHKRGIRYHREFTSL